MFQIMKVCELIKLNRFTNFTVKSTGEAHRLGAQEVQRSARLSRRFTARWVAQLHTLIVWL